MSRFTEILTVSPLPDGRSWVLREPFGYDVGHENSGETIEVPEKLGRKILKRFPDHYAPYKEKPDKKRGLTVLEETKEE